MSQSAPATPLRRGRPGAPAAAPDAGLGRLAGSSLPGSPLGLRGPPALDRSLSDDKDAEAEHRRQVRHLVRLVDGPEPDAEDTAGSSSSRDCASGAEGDDGADGGGFAVEVTVEALWRRTEVGEGRPEMDLGEVAGAADERRRGRRAAVEVGVAGLRLTPVDAGAAAGKERGRSRRSVRYPLAEISRYRLDEEGTTFAFETVQGARGGNAKPAVAIHALTTTPIAAHCLREALAAAIQIQLANLQNQVNIDLPVGRLSLSASPKSPGPADGAPGLVDLSVATLQALAALPARAVAFLLGWDLGAAGAEAEGERARVRMLSI